MDQHQRRSFRRSSSRSPSLTRGSSSFKEKSSGISKSKKKGSGSKKERWLLTRKTWRYMSDAVGSLLPEHKEKPRIPTSVTEGPSGSRRASAILTSPHTPTTPGPAFYSGIIPLSHSYTTSVACVPASHGYGTTVTHVQTSWSAHPVHDPVPPPPPLPEKRASLTRSSICSAGIETDIPTAEQNFDQMCQKEKKFLLWTRTKPKGLSGPVLREMKERRTSSSSSIPGRLETSQTPPRPLTESKRSLDPLEYYSPEEDLMDDYDEYDLEEEQLTVREFPPRKSSSGASSVVSIASAGNTFWTRPTYEQMHHTSGESYTVVTVGPGIQRYYRTTGIQTDPFPEEILIRLRLQSVREEQLQREEAEKLREVKGEIGIDSPPPEGVDGTKGSVEMPGQTEDKKSEESGYSSSISDTVMRYLRMVRKNSKSDTKEDKFKTVNYDRSLRNIKSKNVTVEEALEHEKNKALAQQQKSQGITPTPAPTEVVAQTETKKPESSKKVQPTKGAIPLKISKSQILATEISSKNKKKIGPLTSPKSEGPSSPTFPESISSPELGCSPPFSPPPFLPPESVGIQAGEPLVRFLKNLNPLRKFSDISSSYYGSSESHGDAMSPRYSFATGSDASEMYTQSVGDDSSGQSSQFHYYPPDLERHRHSSSEFSDLTFKKQPSYMTPSYITDQVKKSSSTLLMRDKSTPSPSSYSYPKGYTGPKASLSISTPTTPAVSPKPDSSGKMSRYMPTYSSGPVQFLSGLRRKGSSGRDKGQGDSSSSVPSAYSPTGGGFAESISSFLSKRSSNVKSGGIGQGKVSESSSGGSGSSGLSFSLRRAGSGKSGSRSREGGGAIRAGAEHSSSLITPTCPSTVMQKSKSSSSVFHGEKRGSTSSASGLTTVGVSPASTSSGSRLMSKTRIFKSRSKSTGRSTPVCTWTPQGNGRWISQTGQSIQLTDANIVSMSEKEAEALQKLIHAKVRALNPDLDIKVPKEPKPSTTKPKRRPYVLKKKALSTGFFESSWNKEQETPTTRSAIGNIFGIPLSEVISNEKKRAETKLGQQSSTRKAISGTLYSEPDERKAGTTRNSVSSPQDISTKGKGSTESLVETKRGSLSGVESSSGFNSYQPSGQASPGMVPSFVLQCIEYLETNGLQTVGLFRQSGSLLRVRQLREDLESGKEPTFEGTTVHDVAVLLKEFLRDLPEPLLTNDLYQSFLSTLNYRTDKKLQLKTTQHNIQLLPVPNRDTLQVLLKFFAKVASHSEDTVNSVTGLSSTRKESIAIEDREVIKGTKMDSCNVATVIAPNLMPFLVPGGQSTDTLAARQGKETRASIDVIDFMINNHQQLFVVSAEVMDELYQSMLETSPEALEVILKEKAGEDPCLDDLDSSSVFGGSELGEPSDLDEALTPRRTQKREEIVHKEGGKGGQPDQRGQSKGEKSRPRRDPSRDRGTSETEKVISGGESDTSSTKSGGRWFRRKQDPKLRTSSDSGTEKVAKGKRPDSMTWEPKRASSLDSMTLPESRVGKIILVTETMESKRSTSHQNLQVPEVVGRRQSSPALEHGVITASLKIPVPLNLDETEIPFIEEEQLDGRLILSPEGDSAFRPKRTPSSDAGRSGTPSSYATTPPSSPGRLSTTTSMVFSPPPQYKENNTFQFEAMTARFLINPVPLHSSSSPNTSTVITQTRLEQLPSVSMLTVLPLDEVPCPSKIPITPEDSPAIPKPSVKAPIHAESKGKETKGAHGVGLIKSKTADFEKIAKESQQAPLPYSTTTQNLRLRNQGNILLKQEFLLRNQTPTGTTTRRLGIGPGRSGTTNSSGTGLDGTMSTSTPDRHRPVTRKKETLGQKPNDDSGPTTSDSHGQPGPTSSTSNRWKRSELIASRPSGDGTTGKRFDKP